MLPTPRIARVTWLDSGSTTDGSVWGTIREAIDAGVASAKTRCVSVGFVLHDDADAVVLVPHLAHYPPDPDDECAGDMTIPKVAIVEFTYLD